VGALTRGVFGQVSGPAVYGSRPSLARPSRPTALRSDPAVLVVITMTDRTALGLDDEPAIFHGPRGTEPLPAEVARRIAYDPGQSTWRALYRHPSSGIATDVSPRYRPPERMRTFVRLRDGLRSRLPIEGGRVMEIDHVVPYDHDRPERGGATTASGLQSLGRRGHHLKTDGVLRVSGDANGALTFRTRTGQQFVSWPEDWRPEDWRGDDARGSAERAKSWRAKDWRGKDRRGDDARGWSSDSTRRGDLLERGDEGVQEQRHVSRGEGQRRPDLQHVAVPTGRADQDTARAQAVGDRLRRGPVGGG
jgi:hypothetical protein